MQLEGLLREIYNFYSNLSNLKFIYFYSVDFFVDDPFGIEKRNGICYE